MQSRRTLHVYMPGDVTTRGGQAELTRRHGSAGGPLRDGHLEPSNLETSNIKTLGPMPAHDLQLIHTCSA